MDKYCSGCSSTKSLNDFRYIEYFDSYRTICIACESKKKTASKTKRLKHIKKHGVTEGALRGINISAYIGARREAKKIVFSKLPKEIKEKYESVQKLKSIDSFMGYPTIFAAIYIFIEFNLFFCVLVILSKILFTIKIVTPSINEHVLPMKIK